MSYLPPDIDLGGFRKYFGSKFWRAINAQLVDALPQEARDKVVSGVYRSLVNGEYAPSAPKKYLDSNKGFGIVRRVPVFDVKDYCVYFFCVKRIEAYIYGDYVENTFGGWSLGGLAAKQENDAEKLLQQYSESDYFSPFSYNPGAWAKSYGDFNSKLYRRILDSEEGGIHKNVLEFDISNFYDCIRLPVLERKIRAVCPTELHGTIDLLFHFLKYWNKKVNGYAEQVTGLPQDALQDCSRLLAYFYLREYDQFVNQICCSKGLIYFRYADDQMIFLSNKDDAQETLRLCSLKLSELGLNINQKKVAIYTLEELKHYRSFVTFDLLQDDESRHSVQAVTSFCDVVVELDRSTIKSRGYPLIKRLLTADVGLLPLDLRTKFLALCFDRDFITNAINAYYLGRIYDVLRDDERRDFLNMLDALVGTYKYSKFLHEVYVFYGNYKIDQTLVRLMIEVRSSAYPVSDKDGVVQSSFDPFEL